MSAIKNNLNNISGDTDAIVKDYAKLLMLKLSEKFALVLGIIATVFIIATLLLIVLVFCSFTLAGYLNELLMSEYLGYGIVISIYLILILWLIAKLIRSKTPLLTNLFVKFIVFILDVEINQTKNLKGLKQEKINVNHKLDADKTKIKADIQILRYGLMENLFKEFLGLFVPKKKDKKSEDPEPGKEKSPK